MLRIASRALLASLLLAALPARAIDLVSVDEVAWASAVDRASGEYTPAPARGGSARRPLYFWTRLTGKGDAIERLRTEGKLPIRHCWTSSVAGVRLVEPDSATPVEAIKLDIDRNGALVGALQRELDTRGFFDWRTWSGKRHLHAGLWSVAVQYADGTPVLCAGKPCQYTIELQ